MYLFFASLLLASRFVKFDYDFYVLNRRCLFYALLMQPKLTQP